MFADIWGGVQDYVDNIDFREQGRNLLPSIGKEVKKQTEKDDGKRYKDTLPRPDQTNVQVPAKHSAQGSNNTFWYIAAGIGGLALLLILFLIFK